MLSQWSDAEAQKLVDHYAGQPGVNEDLALRVYSSRLIGRDPCLVLHGGGNTSVKTCLPDDLGESVEVLCVKGSGWGLGDIEPAGLPAVRLQSLRALRARQALSDEEMVNAQRVRLLDASAPNPSVETLLHAFLPHKFIDHSHADAILSLVDQPDAEPLCRELFGDRLAIVPYVMPGFALAKLAAEVQEVHPEAEGLLLLQHGLFTFGATARESYERHVAAVSAAEAYTASRRVQVDIPARPAVDFVALAPVLRGLLGEGERPYHLCLRRSEQVRRFVDRPELAEWSQRGVVTPDHVIRTKRLPLLLSPDGLEEDPLREHIAQALARYRGHYRDYVQRQSERKSRRVNALDADPRVVLVPGLGLIGVGASPAAAAIAADLYEHTVRVIDDAQAVGAFQALPEADLFDMEYWSLEQAKLGKRKPLPLAGRVVLLSGAARGIGEATARAFAAAGAALYLLDQDGERLASVAQSLGAQSEQVDVRDERAVRRAVRGAVECFGGLDGVISNAGTAPQGPIDRCETRLLEESFAVNFYAHHYLAQAAVQVMQAQGMGGFLLFNASKAAFNPGKDFGPYALPKTALIALMKQFALECGAQGIRANAVNADRVRSGLLDPRQVEQRAEARGLSTDAYYCSNLLQREVSAEDVAQAFLHLALAPSTTGTVLTVDGGNIAASPR